MSDNTNQETDDARTDGGVTTEAYLDEEINIFKPATPFMRDHLRVIWLAFIAWIVVVFGPTTMLLFAPAVLTETTILGGYPLHFIMTAIGTPLAALLLSVAYALQRDRLDTRYGISHEDEDDDPESGGTVAADGGEN